MSITSVSPAVTPVQTLPLPQTEPASTSSLAGVTKEVRPPHPHHGGHGPSTAPVTTSTATSTDGGVNTLA